MYKNNETFTRFWNLIPTPVTREEVIGLINEIDDCRDDMTKAEEATLLHALQGYAKARCIDVIGISFF